MNTNDIRHAYRMEHQVYESPGAVRDAIFELCDEVDKLRAVAEAAKALSEDNDCGCSQCVCLCGAVNDALRKISTPTGEIPQKGSD